MSKDALFLPLTLECREETRRLREKKKYYNDNNGKEPLETKEKSGERQQNDLHPPFRRRRRKSRDLAMREEGVFPKKGDGSDYSLLV